MFRSCLSFMFGMLLIAPAAAQDVSRLSEVNTPPAGLAGQVQAGGSDVRSLADWEKKRRELRKEWQEFLGAYEFSGLPLQLQVLKTEELEDCTRTLISYQAEPGRIVRAYLLVPHGIGQGEKRPAIVAFHGTNPRTFDKLVGLIEKPERHMGLRLAKQGFVVICPENFLWEKDSYKASTEAALKPHPGSKGMAVMLADGMRAVDVLLARDDVDAQRIGAYGHSLGAKETLYLAAMDDRICAAVASEGGIEVGFSNWDAIWYLGKAANQEGFEKAHHDLLRLIAGHPFLVLAGESGKGSADGERSWPAIYAGHQVWQAYYGKPVRMGLLNHGQGHSLPWEAGEKVIAWLKAYVANRNMPE